MTICCLFFFSSRRRHTRFDCDWSSDVCSSDLQALRVGARDFLTKPLEMDAVLAAIARLLAEESPTSRLLPAPAHARLAETGCDIAGLIGESEAMRRVRGVIGELADSTASVIVQGETGTGKENVARALHATSGAANRPFVALNCA